MSGADRTAGAGAGEVDESILVAAPPERVWAAVADPAELAAWWSYLRLDCTPGGRVEERWTDGQGRPVTTSGVVVDAVPGERLRCSWADEGWPAATEVEVTFTATGGGGTRVRVRHTGLDRLPDAAAVIDAHRSGWRLQLEHLRSYLADATG